MSGAAVTDKHRELAKLISSKVRSFLGEDHHEWDVLQAMFEDVAADAEARGYERGVRAAARLATRLSLDERFGNDILALLPEVTT